MNKLSLIGYLVCSSLLVNFGIVGSYELSTHGKVTERAFERSAGIRKYLEALLIKDTDIFDPSARTPFEKLGEFFENTGTLRHWMMEGAVREDDYRRNGFSEALGCTPASNPQDGEIDRPLNHFFDVQRGGAGLSITGLFNGIPAPAWALGEQGRGPSRTENQFSILDARQYQIKSLTEANKQERDRNTALLFRTLGQVIHLVQDMAQPQHTRNDPHAGCVQPIAGHHSWYEDYIETRARGDRFRSREVFLPRPPDFNQILSQGYNTPKFTTYRDFWTRPDGAGLADFSSRNFFSAGTNLSMLLGNCGGLISPPCNSTALLESPASFLYRTITGQTKFGDVILYMRPAFDFNTSQYVQVAVSSRSLWDQHLEKRGLTPAYSLNTLNYDSMSSALLPRAVGYSEGLLDYYFRGSLKGVLQRVEGSPATIAFPPYTVQLSLTNDSTEAMQGDFRLFSDKPDGTRIQLAEWSQKTFKPGETQDLFFVVPAPGFEIVKQFIVVFQGRLGDEDGAVVGKVVGPAKFLEKWDRGLTGNHFWAHSTETSLLGTNPNNGLSTIDVIDGQLIIKNDRVAGSNSARFTQSYVGPLYHDGILRRHFQGFLPIPITTGTNLEVKFSSSINQQPDCGPDGTCAWQILEFEFSNKRLIQFSLSGRGVERPNFRGAYIEVNSNAPQRFNIHDIFRQLDIPLDNLILGSISLVQQLAPFSTPPDNLVTPDPLARQQQMEVDYIRVSDEAHTDPDSEPDSDPDGNGDGLPDNGIPAPSVFLVAPVINETVREGTVIDIGANTSNDSQVATVEFIVDGFSVFVDDLAPFETDYFVPAGVSQLNIQAIATDRFGRTTSAARTIAVQPNAPPTVLITSPAAEATVDEGQAVTFTVETSHNLAVEYFVWTVNGVSDPLLPNPPFESPYQRVIAVPDGVLALTVQASATDILGRTGTATRTISVIPDPRTTVVGRVIGGNGQPIANATINVLGRFAAQSAGDGFFSILGVSTVGSISATAEADVGGITLRGVSATVSPVKGGTTDLGDIIANAPQRSLYGGASFSVGFNPVSVAAADLNGDGVLDIVSANASDFSRNVSVLLGNGDGTFKPNIAFPTDHQPLAVVIADLNGDNIPDLVTTGDVLLGIGDGTFQSIPSPDIGGTRHIAVADFNGDLIPDVVSVNEFSDSISVFLGDGNGVFQPGQRFSVGSQPVYVVVADLNGNGTKDIVTANRASNDVSVLFGNGTGLFQPEQRLAVGAGPTAIAVADVQNDGIPDLIVANGGGSGFNDISLLSGNGNGTFQLERRFPVGTRPEMLVVADVNHDGFQDIVTANVGSGDYSVLLGGGNGSFQTQQLFINGAEPTRGLAVGDLDRDGKLDVVTALPSAVSLAFGKGDGTFMTRRNFAAGDLPQSTAAADLNGDGKLDLITANSFSNDVSVLLGNGDGTFQAEERFAVGEYPLFTSAADLNSDGKADLVVVNPLSNDLSVLLGNGNGTFQSQQRLTAGDFPVSAALADLNGDGILDLAVANLDPGDVSVLLGNGDGTFQPQLRFAAIAFPASIATADLNGDGFPDIVSVGDLKAVGVLLGNGDGTFQAPLQFQSRLTPNSVAIADLNGDGIPDLAVANLESSEVSVLFGNGDGTFQPQVRLPNVSGAYALAVADVNGDSFSDIVTGTFAGFVTVFLGGGDGSFAPRQLFAAGTQSTSVQLVDVNGDGKPDIVTTDRLADSVSVLLHR